MALGTIDLGTLAPLAYAFIGWLNGNVTHDESLNPRKLVRAAVAAIAAIAGIHVTGMNLGGFAGAGLSVSGTYAFDNLLKMWIPWISNNFGTVISDLEAASGGSGGSGGSGN